MFSALPPKQGLYDPQFEHDACGVGFVVDIAGRKSNDIVRRPLQVLVNLQHRGAKGCEENTGDGAGILIQIPHEFLTAQCRKVGFDLPLPGMYGVGMVCRREILTDSDGVKKSSKRQLCVPVKESSAGAMYRQTILRLEIPPKQLNRFSSRSSSNAISTSRTRMRLSESCT